MPFCAHWQKCPACQFQCMNADVQTQFKKQNWVALIQKFAKLPETIEFVAPVRRTAYRYRAETVVIGSTLGIAPRPEFRMAQSAQKLPESAIPLAQCLLHVPELNALIAHVERFLPEFGCLTNMRFAFEANSLTDTPDNSRITLYADPDVEAQATQTAGMLAKICPNTVIILQILPPKGSHVYPKPQCVSATDSAWYGYDTDKNGHTLYALKGAWTPVNPCNAHIVRDRIGSILQSLPPADILEIGCGCGTHAPLFVDGDYQCKSYTGIDASWPAIQSAQHNAELYGWKNAAFYTDTADHYLVKRYYAGRRADIILMHSNRLPYSPQVAQYCQKFGAKHIIIVSPTAYAIARECQCFESLGYIIQSLALCDTMPNTYHMMAVAHLCSSGM